MKSNEDLENMIKKDLSFKAVADLHDYVLDDILKTQEKIYKANSVSSRPDIRRKVMRNPITRVAAAAAIIIVVLIAMSQLGGSKGSVAWGEVVRNIEASPGFIYRMKQTYKQQYPGTIKLNMNVYGSARYALRVDGFNDDQELTTQTYASLRDEAMTSVSHLDRTYTRIALEGDVISELENMDPKEAFKQFLSSDYTELGRRTIDGVVTEGVEITNPPAVKTNFQVDSRVVQLWVAVDTGLPVLVEVETVGKNGTLEVHTVQDNFQWNVELDASEFEPVIPEDYAQMEVEIDTDGNETYKTTVKKESREVAKTGVQKWRFTGKHPEQGYLIQSEDGSITANIPESWADSPEQAVMVKEELDLQKQQGKGKLVIISEKEVNGELFSRFLIYRFTLSNGRMITDGDYDPDLGNPVFKSLEISKELELLRLKGQGQELATEERQVNGHIFIFKKHRFILSDGTKVVKAIGRLKDNQ